MFGRFSPEVATSAMKTPEDGKILLSVPSAVHSHKPPLHGVYQAQKYNETWDNSMTVSRFTLALC